MTGDEMTYNNIKRFCSQRQIKWSTHSAIRIQERGISRLDVLNCIEYGEQIEDYPTDFPNPSCLIFGYGLNEKVIHVVAGCDEKTAYIITAYYPNLQKFEADLKTRKV